MQQRSQAAFSPDTADIRVEARVSLCWIPVRKTEKHAPTSATPTCCMSSLRTPPDKC
jgi:hypothetical protein